MEIVLVAIGSVVIFGFVSVLFLPSVLDAYEKWKVYSRKDPDIRDLYIRPSTFQQKILKVGAYHITVEL